MASTTTLVDRVKIRVLSSGTGPFQLGPAVQAYRGVEALVDGSTYGYATESGSNFEVGTGVYLASSGTLVRTPLLSSSGGAAIAFPANVELSFTIMAQDIAPAGSLPIVQIPGAGTDVAMSQKATTDALAEKVSGDDLSSLVAALNGAIIQASEAIGAGDFVNVYNAGGNARVRKAIASDPTKFANGFSLLPISNGATGLVVFGGINLAASVVTPASEVWLSDLMAGAWTATPPSTPGSIIQPLGLAIPDVGVFFSLRERVLL